MTIAKDSTLISGALRGLTGPLVKVPFQAGVNSAAAGSSTASIGTGPDNPDGSSMAATLTVAAGNNQSAYVRDTVYGRTIGVRVHRNVSAGLLPATLIVDGVAYPIKDTRAARDGVSSTLITDREALIVPATGLNDGPHSVEFGVASDPLVSRTLRLFGWLAEASAGYSKYVDAGYMSGATAITTTFASFATATGAGPVRKIMFVNTTAATRTVTFKTASAGATIRTLSLAAAGTAGDYAEHDFGVPVIITGYGAISDAAGVNAYTIQGSPLR